MSRFELISTLERLIQLRNDVVRIKRNMDAFRPRDNYKRDVVLPPFPGRYGSVEERNAWVTALAHEQGDAFDKMRAAHEEAYGPKMPNKPKQAAFQEPECKDLKEKKSKMGCLTAGSGIVAGFFALGALFNLQDEMLGTIILIAVIAGAVFGVLKFREKSIDAERDRRIAEARAEHMREGQIIETEHNKKVAAYEEAHAAYLVELDAFMKEYAPWREVYIQYVAEENRIAALLEKDRQAEVAQMEKAEYIPAVEAFALCNNDMVPGSYYGLMEELLELVQAGRADSVKEAINLYEDIQFRERQMAMEREAEERRRSDEERRHREDMRFREEQERNRKKEAEKQAADEERRHQESMKQNADMEKKRQQQSEKEARDRCNHCANYHNCSLRWSKPSTCTGFRLR